MERYGVLLVFKPGVTKDEAAAALKALDTLVEPKLTYPHTKNALVFGRNEVVKDHSRPVLSHNPADHIETYDDDHGSPTFYIP